MAKKKETGTVNRIRKALKRNVGGWWVKIHGGPFQQDGIPDLLGCVQGIFFGIEAKQGKGRASEIQLETIEDIKQEGGYAFVCDDPEVAVSKVAAALYREGKAVKLVASVKASSAKRRSFRFE